MRKYGTNGNPHRKGDFPHRERKSNAIFEHSTTSHLPATRQFSLHLSFSVLNLYFTVFQFILFILLFHDSLSYTRIVLCANEGSFSLRLISASSLIYFLPPFLSLYRSPYLSSHFVFIRPWLPPSHFSYFPWNFFPPKNFHNFHIFCYYFFPSSKTSIILSLSSLYFLLNGERFFSWARPLCLFYDDLFFWCFLVVV